LRDSAPPYAQDRRRAAGLPGPDALADGNIEPRRANPAAIHSFKAPSPEELDHDFMWRTTCRLPGRGRIGIFNRSYYEEVLVVRVHPEFLAGQKLPAQMVGKDIWKERCQDMRNFESYLARQGTLILKFFLHVSKDEQRQRFLARLDEPEKNWKFAARDVEERAHWEEYMAAYQDCIAETAVRHAPWYVVPADHKWYMRTAVAELIVEGLDSLDLHYPKVDDRKKKELAAARQQLEKEGG
jgi:PPK2 family polyphosphate:nucleotide phosphotransferase